MSGMKRLIVITHAFRRYTSSRFAKVMLLGLASSLNFPRMDFRIFRKNFGDIVAWVGELNSFGDITRIRLPRIVVAGDSREKNAAVIRALTGFAIPVERNVPNAIEYRFTNDPSCNGNEAFCTINDSLTEYNISIQHAELVDEINELKNWKHTDLVEPIVLNIRVNCENLYVKLC